MTDTRSNTATKARAVSATARNAQTVAETFDYGSEAELFSTRNRSARKRPVGYRRFEQAAEAIRFAIEELPPASLLGAYLQVDEERYDGRDIRRLYDNDEYPLARRLAA